jgi:hypothetical protein
MPPGYSQVARLDSLGFSVSIKEVLSTLCKPGVNQWVNL